MTRYALSLTLAIDRQHPDFILLPFPVVDDPDAAAFAFAGQRSTQLSDSTAAANDPSCVGTFEEKPLQSQILVVCEIRDDQLRERGSLNEDHTDIIRQSRTKHQRLL